MKRCSSCRKRKWIFLSFSVFCNCFPDFFFTNGHPTIHPSSSFSGFLKPLDYIPFPPLCPLWKLLVSFKSSSTSSQHYHIVPTQPSFNAIVYFPQAKHLPFFTSDPNWKMCNSGRSCATRADPAAGIVMNSRYSLCLMFSSHRSGCRILGRRAPSETLFAGWLVHLECTDGALG